MDIFKIIFLLFIKLNLTMFYLSIECVFCVKIIIVGINMFFFQMPLIRSQLDCLTGLNYFSFKI